MRNKIVWIILFVIIAIAIVVGLILARPVENKIIKSTDNQFNKTVSTIIEQSEHKDLKEYVKTELSDGILYSENGEQVQADIIVGDNYYDTTINDMYLNPRSYEKKKIQIEGMYFEGKPYTFVGRYSTSNLCAYCPVGYSYIEYQLDGKIDKELVNEQDWIKIIGTLEVGNDESTNYEDYYYIKVINLEIMNEKGVETVNN